MDAFNSHGTQKQFWFDVSLERCWHNNRLPSVIRTQNITYIGYRICLSARERDDDVFGMNERETYTKCAHVRGCTRNKITVRSLMKKNVDVLFVCVLIDTISFSIYFSNNTYNISPFSCVSVYLFIRWSLVLLCSTVHEHCFHCWRFTFG